MSDEQGAIDQKELSEAFAGPAMAANRFLVTAGPGGIRIAFLEQGLVGAPPVFRCAAMLPMADAIELRKVLERLLHSLDAQRSQAAVGRGGENG